MYPPLARDYRRRRGHLFIAIALVRAGLPDSARHVALRSRADSGVDPSYDLMYIGATAQHPRRPGRSAPSRP
jgi:hypothetical protein